MVTFINAADGKLTELGPSNLSKALIYSRQILCAHVVSKSILLTPLHLTPQTE